MSKLALGRREFIAALASAAVASAAPPKTQMAVATTCFLSVRRPKDTYEFLEYCHGLGAAGIQSQITTQSPEYLTKLRARLEQHGMWMEAMASLPRTDNDEAFARTIEAAKTVGAICVRSACLSGRRYETFSTMDQWKQFVSQSHAAIKRALAIAEKAKMPIALENHKDWTADEFVKLLKEYSSEYLGVCLDTGNNMSLLDEPVQLIDALLPYTLSTHIKDMAVQEYEDGFLLAEVPFGEGMLDIPQIVSKIKAAKPKVKMTLEMITRDPLKIPCFTEKYWVTMPDAKAARLAAAMRMVRTAPKTKPIPYLTPLPKQAQWQLEEDNVKTCLNYAREKLSL